MRKIDERTKINERIIWVMWWTIKSVGMKECIRRTEKYYKNIFKQQKKRGKVRYFNDQSDWSIFWSDWRKQRIKGWIWNNEWKKCWKKDTRDFGKK